MKKSILRQRRSRRRGLTLVELAIVILVLGIIMGIVYSAIDFGITDDAKKLAVKSAATQLPVYMEKYESENGALQEGDSLQILAENNQETGWRAIKKDLIMDPWNRPYFLCADQNGNRQICSLGEDGREGGDNKNADYRLTDEATWPAWLGGKRPVQ